MSQADLIRHGQLAEKKQVRISNVIAARAALNALINAAVYSQGKKIEDINTAELTVHLKSLVDHQESVRELDEEIKGLE